VATPTSSTLTRLRAGASEDRLAQLKKEYQFAAKEPSNM
jgi:hypothetical protein